MRDILGGILEFKSFDILNLHPNMNIQLNAQYKLVVFHLLVNEVCNRKNHCQNGGSCHSVGEEALSWICTCADDWTGSRCNSKFIIRQYKR